MAHAILSASGSKRWLTCTPSPRLEEQFPGNPTSMFAEEGTLAHELGELKLSYHFGQITKAKYNKGLKMIEKHALFTPDMPSYVDVYADYGVERYNEAKTRSSDAIVSLEQRLDFSHVVPKGFGTGDLVIIADGTLEIIDLKYGKGIEVSAEENTQMMLYALGALAAYEFLYDIHQVQMTIVQPRLDSISTWTILVEELEEWAEIYCKPRAKMAWDGEGDFVSGDHCRFCKARFTCKARADQNMELAKFDFAKAELLSSDEVAEILHVVTNFKSWVKDIEEYALEQAVLGNQKWPGFKVVEGRSNRKYVDDIQVANRLMEAKYDEAIIYEKKLYGLTAMQKLLGKKQFDTLLVDLIEKPPGKPALVVESDKRPEFSSAAVDFKNNEGDDE